MSHLKERKEKNCLNCNAEVYGKYCHICGQENLEPAESLWHLVTHFFNDITHFDGKFFSSLKLLIFKPGFLPAEYKAGRRNSYLNPVRMYVFTSFVFFFVFFSVIHVDKSIFETSERETVLYSLSQMDSAAFSKFSADIKTLDSTQLDGFTRAVNLGRNLKKKELKNYLDSARNTKKDFSRNGDPLRAIARLDSVDLRFFNQEIARMDSVSFRKFTKLINQGVPMQRTELDKQIETRGKRGIKFGVKYQDRAEYDSLKKAGALKEGWLMRKMTEKGFDLNDKYAQRSGELMSTLVNTLFHNFPQMLFVSLPLFALFLKLIYFRHKEFYLVSHGIYTIHLYIFYFIILLAIIGLNELMDYTLWNWPEYIINLLSVAFFFYEYKAMRNFYGQRRAKTIVKFVLAAIARFFIIVLLFIIFLFLSILKV